MMLWSMQFWAVKKEQKEAIYNVRGVVHCRWIYGMLSCNDLAHQWIPTPLLHTQEGLGTRLCGGLLTPGPILYLLVGNAYTYPPRTDLVTKSHAHQSTMPRTMHKKLHVVACLELTNCPVKYKPTCLSYWRCSHVLCTVYNIRWAQLGVSTLIKPLHVHVVPTYFLTTIVLTCTAGLWWHHLQSTTPDTQHSSLCPVSPAIHTHI